MGERTASPSRPAYLDERARAEVLFIAAVTAVAVGDDSGGIAAVEAIPAMIPIVNDPRLRNALQLAVSWSLPILDDFDGALDAATRVRRIRRGPRCLRRVGRPHRRHAEDGARRRRSGTTLRSRGGRARLPLRHPLAHLERPHPARDPRRPRGDLDTARPTSARLDDIDDDQVRPHHPCFVLIAFGELAAEATRRGGHRARRRGGSARPCRPAALADRAPRRGGAAGPGRRRRPRRPQWDAAYTAGVRAACHEALALVRKALDPAPTN